MPYAAPISTAGHDSGQQPLWALDAAEAAQLIRTGAISSRELVAAALSRLDAVNPSLNAVVRRMDDEALTAAAACDTARAAGTELGPLHGVPVTIKVNTDQAGHPNDGGVEAYRDKIASEDSPVVANLRHAGAVIIGRTNTPAYSMRWFTSNALHGATLNPWDAGLTCGGSSGGAGSATAAGIGAIAHGNDIGGSVRYPAYCCGVVGMRPTTGLVPSFNGTAGSAPVAISSQLMAVQGPLTRTVRDNALALSVMRRRDIRDPRQVVPAPLPPPKRPRHAALVPRMGDTHPEVSAAVKEAGRRLALAGWAVEEIEPPRLNEASELWPAIAMPDVLAGLQTEAERHGDDALRRSFVLWRAAWPSHDARQALDALARRLVVLRDWEIFLQRWPVIVMPVSCALPYPVDEDLKDEATTALMLRQQAPMLAIAALGLPGLSVPVGGGDGWPVGVQIVAGRFREDICYEAGAILEAHRPPIRPIDPRQDASRR